MMALRPREPAASLGEVLVIIVVFVCIMALCGVLLYVL